MGGGFEGFVSHKNNRVFNVWIINNSKYGYNRSGVAGRMGNVITPEPGKFLNDWEQLTAQPAMSQEIIGKFKFLLIFLQKFLRNFKFFLKTLTVFNKILKISLKF